METGVKRLIHCNMAALETLSSPFPCRWGKVEKVRELLITFRIFHPAVLEALAGEPLNWSVFCHPAAPCDSQIAVFHYIYFQSIDCLVCICCLCLKPIKSIGLIFCDPHSILKNNRNYYRLSCFKFSRSLSVPWSIVRIATSLSLFSAMQF